MKLRARYSVGTFTPWGTDEMGTKVWADRAARQMIAPIEKDPTPSSPPRLKWRSKRPSEQQVAAALAAFDWAATTALERE